MQKTKVFIIPGLGDDMHNIARFIETKHIKTEVFIVGWRVSTDNPNLYYISRINALIKLVDESYIEGYKVILIGASAGGSFVVNVCNERPDKISLVINLSGRLTQINGPTLVGIDKYRITEPVFMESITRSERIVSSPSQTLKDKFLAFVPLWDELVPIRSMQFQGARVKRIWFIEHIINIALAFTVYRKSLLKAILLS